VKPIYYETYRENVGGHGILYTHCLKKWGYASPVSPHLIVAMVGIILVNGTRNVFLCQSFQSRLDQFGLVFARPVTISSGNGPQPGVWRHLSYTTAFHTIKKYVVCLNSFVQASENTP